MYIGLRSFESWEQNNQRWKTFLGLQNSKCQVNIYQGVGHALFELTHGLRFFLPHKRSVSFFPVGSPYPQMLLPGFYRESYQVALHKWSELQGKPEAEVNQWIEDLSRDQLFVVANADHAFTAEKYPTEVLRQGLSDRRISYIEILHSHPPLPLTEPEPFSAKIYVLDAHRSIAVLGSRLRFYSQTAPLLNWDLNQTLSWPETVENEELIRKVEAHLPPGIAAYFPPRMGQRVFDRGLFKLDDIAGDLFINIFSELQGKKLSPPGRNVFIETPHLCRWGGMVTGPWWTEQTYAEDELSKVVMLSLDAVSQPKLNELVTRAIQACLSKQKVI